MHLLLQDILRKDYICRQTTLAKNTTVTFPLPIKNSNGVLEYSSTELYDVNDDVRNYPHLFPNNFDHPLYFCCEVFIPPETYAQVVRHIATITEGVEYVENGSECDEGVLVAEEQT
jgi:hypothetical protein